MRKHVGRPAGRRAAWGIVPAAALAVLVFTVFAGGAGAGAGREGDGLSKDDTALVAAAKVAGEPVELVVATAPGHTAEVAASLSRYGATMLESFDKVGYLLVSVPADTAAQAAKTSGVRAADVNRAVAISDNGRGRDWKTIDRGEGSNRWHKGRNNAFADDPLTAGPINPFMPTYAINAVQFRKDHPTYDGRGVKVGIVDSGVDLDRPELQTALDAQGKPVKKIIDWVTTTRVARGGGSADPTWVRVRPLTAANSAGFTFPAGAVQANLLIGSFVEGNPLLGGELGKDVNRDGDTTDTFAVLEDQSTKTVWVDTNQDKNFTNDKAMKNYAVNYDVNHFGTDNPATPGVVESVPFVVQTETVPAPGTGFNEPFPQQGIFFVNIGIVSGGHGTHVAGTVAGKGYFGGHFDGVAPNAQLAVARVCLFVTGCFTSDQLDAFIHLAYEDKVDLIQMSIGGLGALNDGHDAVAEIIAQISDETGVQFIFSQGNDGPGANTAGSPGDAFSVIGVGAYQSQETWLANYDDVVSKRDTLWVFSSRGPREDGGLKPNVVAPGSELSTWPAWNMSENPFAGGLGARPYELPPGYEMIQGTSMAAPMTTGASALLLSAAKQNNMTVSPEQLKEALMSSARVIDNYGMYEQGAGLVQVDDAWNVLRKGITTQDISSSAEANTVLAKALGIQGEGIYLREGWKPGQTGTKTITFTRHDSVGSGTYRLNWISTDKPGRSWHNENDGGAFSSAGVLRIPANGSATLPVRISTPKSGIYSAILQLDDPSSPGVEYQVMNTVIAAQQFGGPSYSVTNSAQPGRADKESFFINVDEGVSALTLNEHIVAGRTKLDIIDPFGVPYDVTPCGCAEDFVTGPADKSITIPNPMAGVWEVAIEGSRQNPTQVPAEPNASFTVSEAAVDITPNPWTVDPATVGTTYTQTMTFKNRLAAITAGAVGSTLGSAFEARPTATDPSVAGVHQQTFDIVVPAGATHLHVEIGNPVDPGADLDLFVTDPNNAQRQSAGSTAFESLDYDNPIPGTYHVVVDDFAVPAGTTLYDYSDMISLPGTGQVTVTDPAAAHAAGSTWTAPATVTPLLAPPAGRFLQGTISVVTSTGDVVGRASVDVRNVH